jgi:hypothetical protein
MGSVQVMPGAERHWPKFKREEVFGKATIMEPGRGTIVYQKSGGLEGYTSPLSRPKLRSSNP